MSIQIFVALTAGSISLYTDRESSDLGSIVMITSECFAAQRHCHRRYRLFPPTAVPVLFLRHNIDVTVMFSDNIIAHGLAHNTEPYKTNPQLYRLRLSPVIIYIKYLICLKIFFSYLILCFICPEILHLLHDCIQTGLTAIVPFSREHFSVLTVIKSLIQ